MGTRIKYSRLLEWPAGPIGTSGATIYPGYSYDLAASPSGTFYTLKVSAADYGREVGIRVTGTGTLTVQPNDPGFTFLQNSGTTTSSLVLSAGNSLSVEYRILPSQVVRPMRAYMVGASSGGGSSGGGSSGPTGPWSMKIGAQGWFQVQQDSADSGGDDSATWSGDHAMVTSPAINWSTAYGSPSTPGALSATNIWRPETLALWSALTGPIRFMDWGSINYNPMVNWADRNLPTASQYYFEGDVDTLSDPSTAVHVKGMAYEWMIDLCNRTDRPMWVCVPHQATDAFITSLAQLIKARLKPGLEVYIEYSNETWNFGSGTLNVTGSTYTGGSHRAQADHVIMAGVDGGYPGANAYYKGYAYHCSRSYQCWYLFSQAFSGDTARLKNAVCVNGNIDLLRSGLQNTYASGTYNPHSMPVHLICTAPYIDGQNSADWQTSVNAYVASTGEDNNVYQVKGLATTYSCQFGCYEGGQQAAGSGCNTWASNPDIYNAQQYLYNKLGEAGCSVFCAYTLVGKHYATKAWGLLDNTNETLPNAHKWRATLDWIDANS